MSILPVIGCVDLAYSAPRLTINDLRIQRSVHRSCPVDVYDLLLGNG